MLPRRGAIDTFVATPARGGLAALRHDAAALLDFEYQVRFADTRARGDSRWVGTLVKYHFALLTTEQREIIAFHWHPDVPGRPEPHLHLGVASKASTLLRQAHIPASIVTLPQVLRFAIRELGVEPIRDDWEARLASASP
jgi:hypothetical protein